MAEVVTRLVVAADGSIRALDQFERGMEKAGQATEFTTGAVADYQRRMEAARAAMERGNALTTQTVQRKTAEQRAWERWSATVDKTTALRIRLEREAANASVAATNAVISGFATQEQALATLSALEQRHNAQLAASIAMHNREASAIDNSTAAMRMNTAAANSNVAARRASGAHAGHTTNLLFQAQDIAMMTAMGQAPMMLAMQQGMQVAGVFHQIGNGRQIISAVGGAVMGLLNPLNLATIAFIGLGAAGTQALMGMMSSTEDATTALERHKEWLDRILSGYDAAREAATRVLDRVAQLPQGVVEIELAASLEEQEAAILAFQSKIDRLQDGVADMSAQWQMMADIARSVGAPDLELESWIGALDVMSELRINSGMTSSELDNVIVQLKSMYAESDNARFKEMANTAYEVALELRNMALAVEADEAALRSLQAQAAQMANMRIMIDVQVATDGAVAAINELRALAPDIRTAYEKADEALARGLAAPDNILRQAAQQQYNDTIAALDAQKAMEEARKAATAGGKTTDQWQSANDNFQQRIAQQELELSLIGQSTFEIERQRAAFDLLNQAKQAGIPITAQVTDQIDIMSTRYANLTVEMQRQQLLASTAISINNTLASGFADLWTGIITGSKSATEAIGGLLVQLGQMALNNAFMSLFGGGTAGGIGGALAGIFMPNALGNVYTSPGLSAYSGQIVDQPTLFPFARGIGLMGEAGPEAILPLRRGRDGRLGVTVANQNQANDNRRMGDVHFHINGSGLSEEQMTRAIENALYQYDDQLAGKVEGKVRQMQNDPRAADGGW